MARPRIDEASLLSTTLENMTHGVCVWDESLRLFVSNTRFLELFNLSPAQVRRGVHLRDVLRLSHSIGNYPNKTFEQVYDDYLTKLKTEGTFYLERDLPDGRTVAVYNRPKSLIRNYPGGFYRLAMRRASS